MSEVRAQTSTELRPHSNEGFGLAEAMVSIVMLTTSLLGLAGASAQIGAAMNAAHRRTAALAEVRIQLETLLARPYQEVQNGTQTSEGVAMEWAVTETGRSKEILLVYQYNVRGQIRQDTLVASVRQP